MLAVRLDPDLEARLDAVAKRMGRSKSYLAREALREKIDELEDMALIEEALRDPDAGKTYPLKDVVKRLGLEERLRGYGLQLVDPPSPSGEG